MNITFNGSGRTSDQITFNDVPNIVTLTDDNYGNKATINLEFKNSLGAATTGNNQWNITILGESITNTTDYTNAVNKNFYISPTDAVSTAASVARALRNCAKISANYTIEHNVSRNVLLKARVIGDTQAASPVDTNIPNTHLVVTATQGTASSHYNGSKISLDIHAGDDYVTTLEKSWYGSGVSFNVTPVLNTITEEKKVKQYHIDVNAIKDGEYEDLGTIGNNYATVGYMCNQGLKYIDNTIFTIAGNYSRGTEKAGQENNTILYLAENTIPIAFYNGSEGGMYVDIIYLDSAYNQIGSGRTEWNNTDSSKRLWFEEYTLSYGYFQRATYVDLILGSDKLRYKIIKPRDMTEYVQRIEWINEYGGVSFFDFSGGKTETRDRTIQTYEKNIFGYYTDTINEQELTYDIDVRYNVTLKSHIMEKDGIWLFNSLIQSPKVWTEVNGEKYTIIIDSVSVDELENNNDLYEATVRYRYSQNATQL